MTQEEALRDLAAKAKALLQRQARCWNGEHNYKGGPNDGKRSHFCVCFEMDALEAVIENISNQKAASPFPLPNQPESTLGGRP